MIDKSEFWPEPKPGINWGLIAEVSAVAVILAAVVIVAYGDLVILPILNTIK